MYDPKLIEEIKFEILCLLNQCARRIADLDLSGKCMFFSDRFILGTISTSELKNVIPETWEYFKDAVGDYREDDEPMRNAEIEENFLYQTDRLINDLEGILDCRPYWPEELNSPLPNPNKIIPIQNSFRQNSQTHT